MNFSNRITTDGDKSNLLSSSRTISKIMQEHDLVIIYQGPHTLDHFYLERSKIYQNKFGAFYHDDMIGKCFGSKIYSRGNFNGWIMILEPTPEIWSIAVHTRTQIVNEVDSSVIVMNLDLYPGCVVVESGTGSGCMTMALSRAVFPLGHVYSFEYNSVRATAATEEFKRFNLNKHITVTCADVYSDGFRIASSNIDVNSSSSSSSSSKRSDGQIAPNSVDAVFLDLPQPWQALEHAFELLKPSRPICCYSPCIEQVMSTCEKLRSLGFYGIRMVEARQKPCDGRSVNIETMDLGFDMIDTFNNPTLPDPVVVDISASSDASNSSAMEIEVDEVEIGCKRHRNEGAAPVDAISSSNTGEGIDENNIGESVPKKPVQERTGGPGSGKGIGGGGAYRNKNTPKNDLPPLNMMVAIPAMSMKGHSAFLTFALRPTEEMIQQLDKRKMAQANINSNNAEDRSIKTNENV